MIVVRFSCAIKCLSTSLVSGSQYVAISPSFLQLALVLCNHEPHESRFQISNGLFITIGRSSGSQWLWQARAIVNHMEGLRHLSVSRMYLSNNNTPKKFPPSVTEAGHCWSNGSCGGAITGCRKLVRGTSCGEGRATGHFRRGALRNLESEPRCEFLQSLAAMHGKQLVIVTFLSCSVQRVQETAVGLVLRGHYTTVHKHAHVQYGTAHRVLSSLRQLPLKSPKVFCPPFLEDNAPSQSYSLLHMRLV